MIVMNEDEWSEGNNNEVMIKEVCGILLIMTVRWLR